MGSLLLAVIVGLTTGVLLGLLGGGGSILAVPALIYLLDLKVGPATTVSLIVVGLNSVYGVFRHWRRAPQTLKVDYALALGATGLFGTQVGNWLNHTLPERLLLGSFALMMLLVAGLMLRPPRLNQGVNIKPVIPSLGSNWFKVGLVGLGLGFLTGLFGVGGGFLIVPALVLLLGFGMRMAAATSLLVIVLNSFSALVGRWPLVGLDFGLISILLVAGLFGLTAGNKLAERLPEKTLRRVFAWVIVAIAGYVAFRALT
jgi:uncharacterized protein